MKNIKFKLLQLLTLTASLVATSLLTPQAQAALIVYEGFDYAADFDARNVQANWTGSSFFSVNSPGLTYSNLIVTGNRFESPNEFGREMFRNIGTQAATGTYWLSFIVDLETATTGGVGISLFNGGSENSFYGVAAGNTWGNGGGSGQFATTATTAAPTFLTFRLNMDAGISHMWINATPGAIDPTNATAANGVGGTAFTAFAFDRIRTGVFFGGGNGAFDEIRLGTTFGDVAPIPEPSTYALLAIGLGALVFLRRRRKA